MKSHFKSQGITEDQMKAQYAANAKQLRWMEKKAIEKGKYNGYTPEQLAEKAAEFEGLSERFSY